MTIVSSEEFAANQEKFYNLALNERVVIERGENKFYLTFEEHEVEYAMELIDGNYDIECPKCGEDIVVTGFL